MGLVNTSDMPAPDADLAPAPEADLAPAGAAVPDPHYWLLTRAAIIVALTAGCVTAVATGWDSPVRVVLAVGFLLFCPGLAIAELLEIRDLAQRIAIATATSLALDTLLSLLLIYVGAFSVSLAVAILAAVTLAALSAALLRASTQPAREKVVEPTQ
jgi:O-antigen/teichoic acid export membrane protein